MIIEHPSFINLKKKHAKEIIEFLLANSNGFNILVKKEFINFSPLLPEEIFSSFDEIVMFSLVNYTFESAHIKEEKLIFEAGFGAENFASIVFIELDRIIQIMQDDTPLFINISATLEKPKKVDNPFALNPRNQKFMK